jgi:hypothetical protein
VPDETSNAVESTVKISEATPRSARSSGRDDTGKLVTVANAALLGVPAAYAASQSILVTMIAAAAAVAFAYLARRRG